MVKIILFVLLWFVLYLNSVLSIKQLLYSGVNNNLEDIRQRHADLTFASMNPSELSCYNFTEYASGNIKEIFNVNISSDLKEQIDIYLHNTLIAMDVNDLENISERKAKLFYDSCINFEEVNDGSAYPHLEIIKSLSGWPLSRSDVNNDNLDIYGLNVLLDMDSEFAIIKRKLVKDIENNNIYRMSLEGPGTRYNKPDAAYLDTIIINLEGRRENNSEEICQDIINFSNEIIKISSFLPENKIKQINRQSLKQEIPEIDWDLYFSKLSSELFPETELIIVKNWDYFKELGVLLKKTSKRIVANYLLYNIIYDLDFSHYYWSHEPYKSKRCLNILKYSMSSVLNRFYLKDNFHSGMQSHATEIINNLKKSLMKTFQDAEWLDYTSRLFANDKLNNISVVIGTNPNSELDDKGYEELNIEPNDKYSNIWNIKYFHYKREHLKLGSESLTPTFNSIEPHIVNYNNKYLFVPASILQPPYFHVHFPAWANYAGFGAIFAFNLADIFNLKNIEYTENRLNDWWNMKVLVNNLEVLNCYVSKNKKIFSDKYVAGKTFPYHAKISAESALEISLDAYENLSFQEDYLDGSLEPHLTASSGKLFFIYYAQMCAYSLLDGIQYSDFNLCSELILNAKKYNKYICKGNRELCSYW